MAPTRVTIKSNGSIRIEGDFELYDIEGGKFDLGETKSVRLCRCGLSKDKPFCDSTHKVLGFQSEIKARPVPPPKPK